MKKGTCIFRIMSLVLNIIFMSCKGQAERTMLLNSTKELNILCVSGKVYDLIEIDSLLYNKIINSNPFVISTFKQTLKCSNVGIYQIGYVGKCIDCPPSTYFFIAHKKQIILFNNNIDINAPQAELERLKDEGELDDSEKNLLVEELKRIIIINRSADANRETRRW